MLNSICMIKIYDDALVMPLHNKRSGVYSGDIFLPETRLIRRSKIIIDQAEYCSKPRYGGKCAIYGGYLFGHFGHFLLESLSRLWAIPMLGAYPIVFPSSINALTPWQSKLLELLGLKSDIKIIKLPTYYDELIVPSPGYQMADFFVKKHARYLEVQECNLIPEKKIWLSRSSLKKENHPGDVVNEMDIEQGLELRGWDIVHPQEYDISQQLRMLSESNVLAGFVGSAFHALIFLKGYQGKINIINRPGWHETKSPIRNYNMIAETKKLDQKIHTLEYSPIYSGSRKGNILSNMDRLYETLDGVVR